MNKSNLSKSKNIFSALNNEKRLTIIDLCSDKEYTVTELSKKLNLNYSITVEYISMLNKAGLVSKRKEENKTVKIRSLINLNVNGEIRRIF